jgi:hypothetical protein
MPTYTLIASNTVGVGGVASVTFSSIPATYTDLVIKSSARSSDVTSGFGDAILVQFNGSGASLTSRRLYGTGAGAASLSGTTAYTGSMSSNIQTANTFGNSELYVPNYASANFKSSSSDGVNENNGAQAIAQFSANLWSSTSAITSLTVLPETGTLFLQHSTFYLYGISNA